MVEHFFVWFFGERLAVFMGAFLMEASIVCFVIGLMFFLRKQIAKLAK